VLITFFRQIVIPYGLHVSFYFRILALTAHFTSSLRDCL